MNIQEEKAYIIEQFKQIDDINLIQAIKSLLDYAKIKKHETEYIPMEHQNIVMERFEKIRKNPDSLKDWDKVKNSLIT